MKKELVKNKLQLQRQHNFELATRRRLVTLYKKKEKEVYKKYRLDKKYDQNIAWVLVVTLLIAVLGVSHPEVQNLALVMSISCLIACSLVIVRKLYTNKESKQSELLIRDEINYEFEKELVNIKQHFESLGYTYPNITTKSIKNDIKLLN